MFMKKKVYICILCITFILTLTGCAVLPAEPGQNADEIADTDYIAIGKRLTVHNTDDRLALLNNMDTLSSDGLYYASWTAGKAEPFENADGDTVDLYDAQLYLLAGEYTDAASAEKNLSDWLEAGRSNYEVSKEQTLTFNGQSYTIITYRFINEENPYSHGMSAFGINENLAVCVELACKEEYNEDLAEMLATFLEGCSYH